VPTNIQIRVTSTLINSSVPLMSNVLRFGVTPYAIPPKVAPPATDELFIVGSATPGMWNNPVPTPAQKFTRVNATFYTLTFNVTGGGSYLLLPTNGIWAKYGCLGGNNSNNPDGDDFKAEGGDFLAPAVGGMYRLDVDFQRGKFTMTKL
jgi:starch-binding outer membrane protein SusE/F